MRHTFPYTMHREARLIKNRWGFRPGENPAENQQKEFEKVQHSMQPSQVPNVMNQRMNTTREKLGKTRDEYIDILSKQYRAITDTINTMRRYGHRMANTHRANAARFNKIGYRHPNQDYKGIYGMEKYYEGMGAADRYVSQFGNLQALEEQRDLIRNQLAILGAERRAGVPDHVLPTPTDFGPGPAGQDVGRITVLTTGPTSPDERFGRRERFAAEAPPELVEQVNKLEGELQEVTAVLFRRLDEKEQPDLISLTEKMGAQDPDTLRKFFELYFKDKKALAVASVTIDDTDPVAVKAKAFAESLSPAEIAVAEKFIDVGMRVQENAKFFEDLPDAIQARVLKYAKRWNKARPDTAEKLIAEGMLNLDGVDVEASLRGNEIDDKKIQLFSKEMRFMGFFGGWIKLILGWKKLIGQMQQGQKPSERKVPAEMTKDERDAEVKSNTERIAAIKDRQKVLPDEIKKLEGEIAAGTDMEPDEKKKMTDALAEKKKELEDGEKEITELEERNAALAAVVDGSSSEVPEASRVAFEQSKDKSARMSRRLGLAITVEPSTTQNYDKTLIVLNEIERAIDLLTDTEKETIKNAKADTGGTTVIQQEGVSITIKNDAPEAAALLKKVEETMNEKIDPAGKERAKLRKFMDDFFRVFKNYTSESAKELGGQYKELAASSRRAFVLTLRYTQKHNTLVDSAPITIEDGQSDDEEFTIRVTGSPDVIHFKPDGTVTIGAEF